MSWSPYPMGKPEQIPLLKISAPERRLILDLTFHIGTTSWQVPTIALNEGEELRLSLNNEIACLDWSVR